jgi:hypothetical protein
MQVRMISIDLKISFETTEPIQTRLGSHLSKSYPTAQTSIKDGSHD